MQRRSIHGHHAVFARMTEKPSPREDQRCKRADYFGAAQHALIHSRISFEISDGVIPMVIVSKSMVKDRRVPLQFTGKEDMRNSVPFFVSVGVHLEASEAILDSKGNQVAIQCLDML
jgi:hypothetical protein